MIYLLLLSLIIAYLLGSFPTSVIVGNIFFKKDIREYGSGNPGATNTFRLFGWKSGVAVLIFDALKGWGAIKLAELITPLEGSNMQNFLCLVALAAVTGHIFPLFTCFKGGKGVATLMGVGIALFPLHVAIATAIFILSFGITRIISVSSLFASILFPVLVFFIPTKTPPSIGMYIFASLVACLVVLTHLSNLKRIFSGEEKKLINKKKH